MITGRDLEIIKLLDAQGLATSKQLASIYFPTERTGRNRISKLLKTGMIEKISSKQFVSKSELISEPLLSLSENDYVYVLGAILSKARGSSVVKDLVRHNLLCNDILQRTLTHLKDFQITISFEKHDKRLHSEFAPDITLKSSNFKLGIEVERTLKRDRFRYYKKFSHYHDSDFTHILYVCKNSEMELAIRKLATQFPFIGSTYMTFESDIKSHKLLLTEFLNKEYIR